MANQYLSMENLRYLLYEVHKVEETFRYARFQDHDREGTDIFLDSVKDFSDQELYPCFREMDEDPARFEEGRIIVHPQVKTLMRQGGELGLISGMFDYDDGGLQLPMSIYQAAYFIVEAANNNMVGYLGLTMGSAELILEFGNEELKETYVPKMLTGEWAGTMCLTEPQAGSSLSDITTTAYPAGDGTYRLKGQKIFISGGDHAYADNFVHLVLARIEGAPAGTKGISLFVVPKLRPDEQGGLTPNDVTTAGDFQKMGQRGFCTTHLVFGEDDDCRGWLVGKPHRGLAYMFLMMNGARIGVGRGGIAIATAAYYASLQYAQERPQGRRLTSTGRKDLSQEQTLIINHPDVRRMLLFQKAVAEGSLSLLFQACRYQDESRAGEEAHRGRSHLLLELLTPVVKTYPAEQGRIAVDNGLQVLGGYGFCADFVLQQYYRDIRIYALYEGTTGIQSLDLLGRKVTVDDGKAVKLLMEEMKETIDLAENFDELAPYARVVEEKMMQIQRVLEFLLSFARRGDYERFLSDATVFMDFFGTILIGWQWLKMAATAKEALVSGKMEQTIGFYEGKIHTMKFFFKYEMPKTTGLMETLIDQEVLTIPREQELIS